VKFLRATRHKQRISRPSSCTQGTSGVPQPADRMDAVSRIIVMCRRIAWLASEVSLSDGKAAVTGGTGVFGLFLDIGFDAFPLSRAGKVLMPGGRPVFPQVPGRTPKEVLIEHGLVPGPVRVLDARAEATLVTWQTPFDE
jgi:hypothetical protein